MAFLFKFGCLYTIVISLCIIKMTSGQWPDTFLHSPEICEDKYNYINVPCVRDFDCMKRFIQCQCIPQDVLDVLLDYNDLPLEPDTLCLYSIYVMGAGEPICCDFHKRNIPMTTPAPLSSTWKLMIGNRFPLPIFHKKQQKISDSKTTTTTKVSKKSETLHDLITILRELLKDKEESRAIVATETNENRDDNVKDIRNNKNMLDEDIKLLVYRLLYDLKQGRK
ncbi:hypothetical protein ACF0H5_003896 [Mactra antiquata]